MPRFKLPLTEEEAHQSLMVAIKVEVEYRHKEFVMNGELESQVRHLSAFLTQESNKFGILLAGGCGNGKTTIIKALQNLINALRIPNQYNDKEYAVRFIDAKSLVATCKSNYEDWKRLMYQDLLAIDDLGTEPRDVMDYGNIINPTADILTRRYENQLFTIISTNLSLQDFRDIYSERVFSRITSSYTLLKFTGSDIRIRRKIAGSR